MSCPEAYDIIEGEFKSKKERPEGCIGCDLWGKDPEKPNGCFVYSLPDRQHTRIKGCAMRTHDKVSQVDDTFKLNPLKASKRKQKGKK